MTDSLRTTPSALSRRFALKLAGAGAALLGAPAIVRAQPAAPDLLLFMMGDIHSGYRYYPQIISTIRSTMAANPRSAGLVLVAGDMNESGNVLSVRNKAAIDFQFFSEILNTVPMIVTMGNHDADIFDMAVFIQSLTKLGISVISNITDTRTGKPFAPAMTSVRMAGHQINFAGFGTTALSTYSAAWQPTFNIPDPGTYASQNMAKFVQGASLMVPIAHAGFVADKAIIPSIPANLPFIMLGAHDHLNFTQSYYGRSYHLQTGAWAANLSVAQISFTRFGPIIQIQTLPIDSTQAGDATLAAMIAQQKAQYLTSTDTQVLGTMPQSLNVDAAAIYGLGLVKNALGVDAALCGNTTFGDGLHAGPVTNYDLASFIRFTSYFTVASVDGATLANTVLPLTNQFGSFPYSQRTSGYLYTTPITPVAGKTYRIAVNTFSTGLSGLPASAFTALPQTPAYELKAIVGSSLPH